MQIIQPQRVTSLINYLRDKVVGVNEKLFSLPRKDLTIRNQAIGYKTNMRKKTCLK